MNVRLVALLKKALQDSGLKRDELAQLSGVPDGTLAGIFAGTKPVYAEQLVGLSAALDIDVRAWMGELEELRQAEQAADELAKRRAQKSAPGNPATAKRAARTERHKGRADG